MSLKVEVLLRKLALPKKYFNNDFVFSEKFKEEANSFVKFLNQCNGKEFKVDEEEKIKHKIAEIIDMANQNINSIIKVLMYYQNADLKSAQEEFDTLMSRINEDIFISTIDDYVKITSKEQTFCTRIRITPGYRYFRVRPVEYETSSISQNADELFHIPLSKRAYSNNERFSLAGFPCLYLSTMLPLAWQECGYPQKYYYSEYQYKYSYDEYFEKQLINKELKFLSLYSPDEICNWGRTVKYNHFELWLDVVTKYLKSYPLILACSFVNQSGKVVPYKQEYIIPQMLMQWVQRNNSVVQGISCFTCIDTSMWPAQWCAYNIVIPAMEPYDDKMYSNALREKFCWTEPKFYTVPIADKKYNEHDREFIYGFISDITSTMRTYQLPVKLINLLNEMMNVSGCLMNLLDNGSSHNMQLALHILNSLESNCSQLKSFQLESYIDEVLHDNEDPFVVSASNINDACDIFRNLYNRFIGNVGAINSIEKLIGKYKTLCWNDLHPHSEIVLLYSNGTEIIEPLKWLRENHVLHFIKKIDSSDNTVEYLKNIAKEAKVSIQDFWDLPIENDEWIKLNIRSIKTPIFIKQNDVSILSPDGTAFYEFVQIGFDKDLLAEKLNLT